ncbi:MAG: hypothetical protein H6737_24740 [Alphaproteobacteria bacterium]|nr:hypothetical protein [Alphaproteobacteria bacterium]
MGRRARAGALGTGIVAAWAASRMLASVWMRPEAPDLAALANGHRVEWLLSAGLFGIAAALAAMMRGHESPLPAVAEQIAPVWTGEVDHDVARFSGRWGRPDPYLQLVLVCLVMLAGSLIAAGLALAPGLVLAVMLVGLGLLVVAGRPGIRPVEVRCYRDRLVLDVAGDTFSAPWSSMRQVRATAESLEIVGDHGVELDLSTVEPAEIAGLAADLDRRRVEAGSPSADDVREADRLAGLVRYPRGRSRERRQ